MRSGVQVRLVKAADLAVLAVLLSGLDPGSRSIGSATPSRPGALSRRRRWARKSSLEERQDIMANKDFIWGVGRRKTAVARVRIAPGTGLVTINRRPFEEYFRVEALRQQILAPLEAAGARERFDVHVNVLGGGPAGQAGACVMGVARALVKAEPELVSKVRPPGFLTRDSRMVERKKYGLHKARRGCQFSKR